MGSAKKPTEELVNPHGSDETLTQQFIQDLLNEMTRTGTPRHKSVHASMTSAAKEKKGLAELQKDYLQLERDIQEVAVRLDERIVLPAMPSGKTAIKQAAAVVWILEQVLRWLKLRELGVKAWVVGGGPVIIQGAAGPIVQAAPGPEGAPAPPVPPAVVHHAPQAGALPPIQHTEVAELAQLRKVTQQQAGVIVQLQQMQQAQQHMLQALSLQQGIGQPQPQPFVQQQGAPLGVQPSRPQQQPQPFVQQQHAEPPEPVAQPGGQPDGGGSEPAAPSTTSSSSSAEFQDTSEALVPFEDPEAKQREEARKANLALILKKGIQMESDLGADRGVMAKGVADKVLDSVLHGVYLAQNSDPLTMVRFQKKLVERAQGAVRGLKQRQKLVLADETKISDVIEQPWFKWAEKQLANPHALRVPTKDAFRGVLLIDDWVRRLSVEADSVEAAKTKGFYGRLGNEASAEAFRELAIENEQDSADRFHSAVNLYILGVLEPRYLDVRLSGAGSSDIGSQAARESLMSGVQQLAVAFAKGAMGYHMFTTPALGGLVASTLSAAAGALDTNGWSRGWVSYIGQGAKYVGRGADVLAGMKGMDGNSNVQKQGVGMLVSGAASASQALGTAIDYHYFQKPANEKQMEALRLAGFDLVAMMRELGYDIPDLGKPGQLQLVQAPAARLEDMQQPLTAIEQAQQNERIPERVRLEQLALEREKVKVQQGQIDVAKVQLNEEINKRTQEASERLQQAAGQQPLRSSVTIEDVGLTDIPSSSGTQLTIAHEPEAGSSGEGASSSRQARNRSAGASVGTRTGLRSQGPPQANQRRGMTACICRRGPGAKARLPCRSKR